MITANDQALRRNLARMLDAYGADQASVQRAAHIHKGRKPKTFRYVPTPFHNVAVDALGYGDSETVATMIHAPELNNYLGRV